MVVLPATSSDVVLVAAAHAVGVLTHHALVDLAHDLDDDRLLRAVERTLADIPVLGCRYVHGQRRDRWEGVSHPVEEDVHIERVPEVEAATHAWIERRLTPEGGRQLRIVLLRHPDGSRLVISLTHAAVDGAGSMAVAATLGAHLTGRPPLPVEARRSLMLPISGLPLKAKALLPLAVIKETVHPLRMVTQPAHDAFAGTGPPGWVDLVLDVDTTSALKERARRSGGTVNDALVAALARVAASHVRGDTVWVAYTVDFRRYLGPPPRLLAGNLSGVATVALDRSLARGPDALPAVVGQTRMHRSRLSALSHLLGLVSPIRLLPHPLAHRLVPWMSRLLLRPGLRRGLIVTNIGRIDAGIGAFGDLIKDLRIIGPSADLAPIPTVAAFGLKGRLHLHVHSAPGQEAAGALSRQLHGALKAACDGG